ncbi:MAG: DUF2911 domain-containing protein [Gemmatimonadota bacterium]
MRSSRIIVSLVLLGAVVASPIAAQSNRLTAAASTRATAVVSLSAPRVQGQPAPTPLTIKVEYGQPHVRGRAGLPTELAKDGTIWRVGANAATTLTTEVDLSIGGAEVPKGAYSLYAVREGGKTLLIINKNTGQWGTEYDGSKDLARVPLTSRTAAESLESLQIALVPAPSAPNTAARGVLSIAWGTLALSTEWVVR